MFIGWTTVADRPAAEALANLAVARGAAVCVQIDGPIRSVYRWEGRIEQADEFRLCMKFTAAQLAPLEELLREAHPYDTPEWIVVQADRVGEKYLSWANTNSSTPPL